MIIQLDVCDKEVQLDETSTWYMKKDPPSSVLELRRNEVIDLSW